MITERELRVVKEAVKDISIILGRIGKRENAKASSRKAKERGTRVGRKKIRNDDNIWKLRDRGLSIRAIAKLEGVSTTVVHRALMEREQR